MRKYKATGKELLRPAFRGAAALIVSASFFIAGISAGIFLELMMNPDKKADVVQYLLQLPVTGPSNMNFPNPFSASFANNLLLLLLVFTAGLSVFLFTAALPVLFYKGLTIGFSTCLIMEALSFKGISLITLSIMPQNILIVPAFIFAAAGCTNYALLKLPGRRGFRNRETPISIKHYCSSFILPAAMIFLGCIVEGLLFPIVF